MRTRRAVGPAPPASKEAATAGLSAGGRSGGHRRRARSHRTRAADQDEVQTAQGGTSKVRHWGVGGPSESTEVTATGNPHASYVGLVYCESSPRCPHIATPPGVLSCPRRDLREHRTVTGQSRGKMAWCCLVSRWTERPLLPIVATPPVCPSMSEQRASAESRPYRLRERVCSPHRMLAGGSSGRK